MLPKRKIYLGCYRGDGDNNDDSGDGCGDDDGCGNDASDDTCPQAKNRFDSSASAAFKVNDFSLAGKTGG